MTRVTPPGDLPSVSLPMPVTGAGCGHETHPLAVVYYHDGTNTAVAVCPACDRRLERGERVRLASGHWLSGRRG